MTNEHSTPQGQDAQPVILPRSEHGISRTRIDADSLKVLYRLSRNGHKAYLVGGGVRDLLLDRAPKDFDIGTDATPNQVKNLFRNCFLVGRRFRLAHVRFGGDKVVEVATFRRQPSPNDLPENPEDHFFFAENVFGTPEQDAFRRDFTINALFYDIETFSVIDYVGGLADLQARRLRVIGDPLVRFTEDPVRMLRALEFSARLGFTLDETTREGIYRRASLIAEAAPARVREELMELFRHRVAGPVLAQAQAMGLLEPLLAGYQGDLETFSLLERIDKRTAAGTKIEEHFALAALFLSRFRRACPHEGDLSVSDAVRIGGLVLAPHCGYFHISHGTRHMARELMVAFFRFSRGPGRKGERRFLQHPLTAQALELYRMWTEVTQQGGETAQAWEKILTRNPEEPRSSKRRPTPEEAEEGAPKAKPRRRRSKGRRRRSVPPPEPSQS